jgi:hypothetical protein
MANEAKRKFRFLLTLSKGSSGGNIAIPTVEKWLIQKVTRPSFQISEATHSYLNHTFYFPGRLTWQDVSFTIVDALYPDTSGILMGMLEQSGYRLPAAADANAQTMSKAKSIINLDIQAIDADGKAVDKWTLYNAWISQSNFGDFDYTADDLMSVDVTVKYDYATYAVQGQGKDTRNPDSLNTLAGLK